MEELDLFFNNLEQNLDKNKKIILIAGASSSGKSYTSTQLCNYFNNKQKNAIVFSADNYYKGLSRTIVQKALINNNYTNEVKSKFKEICKIVKIITKNSPFTQKMSENNVNLIKIELSKLFDNNTTNRLINDIVSEFNVINFDEPFAVDLLQLAKHINILNQGGEIIVPEYSFKTSEVEFFEKNKLKAADYDVIIIEGIYALRDEILNNIDRQKVITASIECDLKTLISRKLDRDLTKQRSTFSKEQIITSFLTQVMPSFFSYIYPTFKNADFSYSTALTQNEINDRFDSQQIKYLAIGDIDKYLCTIGASIKSFEYQTDYFLEDKVYTNNQNVVLRIREQNGLATALTLKSNSQPNSRKVESYDLCNDFKEENRQIGNILNNFIDNGFYVSAIVNKARKIFEYNGIIIKVDKFEDQTYVEFENVSLQNLQMLKNKLLLGAQVDKSYYEIKKDMQSKENSQECEIKLKIHSNIDKFLKNLPQKKLIFQTYLNLQDSNTIEFVNKFLPKNFNISLYNEARIRKIGNQSFLTLKSKGGLVRYEYEKEIPVSLTKNLDKLSLKGRIIKERYDIITKDNIIVSIDNYLDRELKTVEVEFNQNLYTENQIIELVKEVLPNIELENVTNNFDFKNSSLAK